MLRWCDPSFRLSVCSFRLSVQLSDPFAASKAFDRRQHRIPASSCHWRREPYVSLDRELLGTGQCP